MTEQFKTFWTFDDVDLTQNRKGQLSEKQKTILEGEHKAQKHVFLGVGRFVVLLFLCVPTLVVGSRVVLPAILSENLSGADFLPSDMGFAIVLAVMIPVLAVGLFYTLRANKKADVNVRRTGGKVAYVWGTKRVRTPSSSVRNYRDVRVLHLSLGDKTFEMPKDLQEIIKEGEEWTIYYPSYPFRFLSGEMILK